MIFAFRLENFHYFKQKLSSVFFLFQFYIYNLILFACLMIKLCVYFVIKLWKLIELEWKLKFWLVSLIPCFAWKFDRKITQSWICTSNLSQALLETKVWYTSFQLPIFTARSWNKKNEEILFLKTSPSQNKLGLLFTNSTEPIIPPNWS